MSPLQQAVKTAIAEGNIDHIYPVFMATEFHVAAHDALGVSMWLTHSPSGNGLCLTVAEDAAWLKLSPPNTTACKSAIDLLEMAQEIMLVFEDGGYLLTRDQLDWFIQCAIEEEE